MFRNLLPSLYRRDTAAKREELPARKSDELFGFMEEFFRAPWRGGLAERGLFPALDVAENEQEVIVTAEVPGLEPKDLELTVERGTLVLKGEKRYDRKSPDENPTWQERGFGSFQRMVPLPECIHEDKVKADYKNGVLTVRIPKDESRKPQRISIQG